MRTIHINKVRNWIPLINVDFIQIVVVFTIGIVVYNILTVQKPLGIHKNLKQLKHVKDSLGQLY